jgi:hypothetical protein
MEDFFEVRSTVIDGTTVGLFGVFDGKHTKDSNILFNVS